MKLTTLFDNNGEFVVTGEVGPIKGAVNRDKNIDPLHPGGQISAGLGPRRQCDRQPVCRDAPGIAGRQCRFEAERASSRFINSPAGTATASPCKAIC
jgi:hypothetical protein